MDPIGRTYDSSAVRRAVVAVLAMVGEDARARGDAVDRALIVEFGLWIAGWSWSPGEGGGGGPVTAYCCHPHSLGAGVDKDTETVVAAVANWHGWLERLSGEFDLLDDRSPNLAVADKASRAACYLLARVLDWCGCEDAWYQTFEVVLAWYLEREVGAGPALAIARQTVDGRFSSWVEPTEDQRESVGPVAAGLTTRMFDTDRPDALASWLAMRRTIRWDQARSSDLAVVSNDGHEQYIREFDAARSPERAARMSAALEATRIRARAGKPLDMSSLTEIQETVLGEPAVVRTTDAYAHGGAERYGISEFSRKRFDKALADTAEDAIDAHARAVRIYLDVCMFHPFADGNARAARLALDHVLTSSGLALHSAAPLFAVARRSLERYGVYSFLHVTRYFMGRAAPANGP